MPGLAPRRAYLRRGMWLAAWTVGWNIFEGIVALVSGAVAGSIALVGFGVDSLIEILAGLIVLWRLGVEISGALPNEGAERRAIRLIAITFFALAVYVTIESVRNLMAGDAAAVNLVGLALTGAAFLIQPVVAHKKRMLGREMDSATMRADAKETDLCVYLSAAVFIGLAANAVFGWWWMDSIAALAVVAIAAREGYEAWTTEDLCDC